MNLKTITPERARTMGLEPCSKTLNPHDKDDLRWIANDIIAAKARLNNVRFAVVRTSSQMVELWRNGLTH